MFPALTAPPLQKPTICFAASSAQRPVFSLKAAQDSVSFGARRGSLLPISYGAELSAHMNKHPEKYADLRQDINSGAVFPSYYTALLDHLRHQGWAIQLEKAVSLSSLLQSSAKEPVDPSQKMIRIPVKITDSAESIQQAIAEGVARAVDIDGLGILPPNAKLSQGDSFKALVKSLMDVAYGTSRPWAQNILHSIGGAEPKKDPSGQGLFTARIKDLLLGKTPYTADYKPENELKAVYKAIDLLVERFRN